MGHPARKKTPPVPPLTPEDIRRAQDLARLPDGTVHPLLFGAAISAPLHLNYDHDNPHDGNHHDDDA